MSQAPEDDPELRALMGNGKLSERVAAELDSARERLLDLTMGDLSTADLQGAQAEQSRRCWELESLSWHAAGDIDKAAACSKESAAQGKLAIAFRKATLVDRVARLEEIVAAGKRKGGKIRAASRGARK